MQIIIDRFEGEFAIVELSDKTIVKIPKILVPDALEGDIIDITINKNETKNRKNQIVNLIDDIFED